MLAERQSHHQQSIAYDDTSLSAVATTIATTEPYVAPSEKTATAATAEEKLIESDETKLPPLDSTEVIQTEKPAEDSEELLEESEQPVDSSPDGKFLKFDEEVGRGSFKTVYRYLTLTF